VASTQRRSLIADIRLQLFTDVIESNEKCFWRCQTDFGTVCWTRHSGSGQCSRVPDERWSVSAARRRVHVRLYHLPAVRMSRQLRDRRRRHLLITPRYVTTWPTRVALSPRFHETPVGRIASGEDRGPKCHR